MLDDFQYPSLFLFLFHQLAVNDCEEPSRVETLLVKIGHKKRKDVSSPIMQVSHQHTGLELLKSTNVQFFLFEVKYWHHRRQC